MLWIEKHKPRSFEEVTSHREVVSMLESYTLDTVPNLIIHGQPGHNKKTVLYSFISHLYGKYPNPKQRTMELDVGTAKIEVSYLVSDEMVEMCPSEYGHRDRHVVQKIIKDMAQTRPVLGMFGAERRSVRVLVIDQSEDLSRDAQASLRRTMELYSSHFRIIMLCTEVSRLIDPIRSRCLLVRMRGFTDAEMTAICESVLEKEGFSLEKDVVGNVCANSLGNCKRALCLLEIHCLNRDSDGAKRPRTDLAGFRLGWETKIDAIVEMIKSSPGTETMAAIRKRLYELIVSHIPPSIILLEMMRGLCKGSSDATRSIVTFALLYDERIRLGTKALYHLEAFAASSMCVLSQKN